jgi:4-amino-4-deoxy-L-arabinose transferase-like glycosyltransferase
LFWIFILAHLTLWTAIPAFLSPNAPLDVIEGYAWGHEWLIGTYKHPPMQSWILEIMAQVTDRAAWGHFFASQLSIVVAFWAVWQTGRRMMGETEALIGTLLLEGIVYYNYTSPEFNPNVLQLPFWALIGLYFYRSVKDNRLTDWLLLGMFAAGGLYSKYSTALLLLCVSLLLIGHPEARKRLKGPGPWLALAVMVILFLPHAQWLINHDFQPFTYASTRLHQTKPHTLPAFILSPLSLIVGQFVALLPMALVFLVFSDRITLRRAKRDLSFDRVFLDVCTFGPFALTFLLSFTFGFQIHDMWGTPFWNFAGIWVMLYFKPELSKGAKIRFTCVWAFITLSILVVYAGATVLYPYVSGHAQRVNFPGRQLSKEVTAGWRERFTVPLTYVVGDVWPAGNVAYYAPARPHVFIDADPAISPWINKADFTAKGGVIVWCIKGCLMRAVESTPNFVARDFPKAEIQPNLEIPRLTGADIAPAELGWAIVPPQNHP